MNVTLPLGYVLENRSALALNIKGENQGQSPMVHGTPESTTKTKLPQHFSRAYSPGL